MLQQVEFPNSRPKAHWQSIVKGAPGVLEKEAAGRRRMPPGDANHSANMASFSHFKRLGRMKKETMFMNGNQHQTV